MTAEREKTEPRIGVYICHCGMNIAATVDVEMVRDYAGTLPRVVLARDHRYTCSEVGQAAIAEDIKNENLDRVVVASCSPRLHEKTFQRALASAGLNPFLLEMANIREQCSWVHPEDREGATEKAKDLVRSAVARAALLESLEPNRAEVTPAVMVVGGGVAGISAALFLDVLGIKTYLVEKDPSIGGHMAMLDKTFPTLDCSLCILAPKMVDAAQSDNITLYTNTEVKAVEGRVGEFRVNLRRRPRYVDETKCVACGLCTEKCPVKAPDEFNQGLSQRKSIYIPFPQAIPASYVIEPETCLKLTEDRCGNCAKICDREAINFEEEEEELEVTVGAILLATGFELFEAEKKENYGYGLLPQVITSLEFERILNADGPTGGKVARPSDGKTPSRIAFIQCVGSRDEGLELHGESGGYCSRVCCMVTAKQALMVKEKMPDVEIYVYYIDMRTAGKGFEEFYQRSREMGIVFVRGKPGEISEGPGEVRVSLTAEDADTGYLFTNEVDMVVLACGLRPPGDLEDLARRMVIPLSSDGFLMEAHPKLRPAETAIDGIVLAGCAQFPKDIPDTVAQAGNAAVVAAGIVSKDTIEIPPLNAEVNLVECTGCGLCEESCPYGAIRLVETEEGPKAEVAAVACHGCGVCAASCPEKAIDMRHFSDEQILAQVKALSGDGNPGGMKEDGAMTEGTDPGEGKNRERAR